MNTHLSGRYRRSTRSLLNGVLFGTIVFMTMSAQASNETMQELLRILRDKGSLTQEEYEMLVNASETDDTRQAKALEELVDKTHDLPSVSVSEGKYVFESADGRNSFRPIGRIFWDQLWTSDDGSAAVFDGGSELRRARLGVEGKVYRYWKFKLEYDFAGADADLKDGWIAYGNRLGDNSKYEIKVGQHHVPFGLTTISSSKYMTFARRPLFADGPLSPARQAGVAATFHDADYRWMVAAGFFHDEPGDGAVGGPGESAKTRAIRVTGIPLRSDDDRFLHLGGSLMHIDQGGDDFKVRQRAVTHLDPVRMFDTGTIAGGVDGVDAMDLEALAIYDSFYAMAEFVNWSVDGIGTTTDFDLGAWSIEAGVFLTGESKGYKGAKVDSVKPKRPFPGGPGAWEVGLRFENMDLNDGAIVGGDGDVFTAGVNWYPVKNIRLMLDFNKLVSFDRPGNVDDSNKPSSVTLRTQVYW